MSTYLPAIEIETRPNPEFAVIWLHGLGADGNDFAPIVPELGLNKDKGIRFVFPHAPAIPVTCNNGYVMRAWYDILFFEDIKRHADRKGIETSVEHITALIKRENERGIPTERILIAGFSQGGAMAYTVGLTYPEKLAGVIALSTYIPSPELIAEQAHPANAATPVFAGHGSMDPVVPMVLGQAAVEAVKTRGNPVEWHTWPMQHSVCIEEIRLIGSWINQRFA
ncbi:dienelactone hydrolase family protein [Burkholderiaceae bacterium DAT-1]|nr:dienelactone hydrolase family protein [Burkholderiaceae bacterium DAT-1]